MIKIREYRLNRIDERAEMALIQDCLDELAQNQSEIFGRELDIYATYRFKSSFRTSGLTPTRFRSILAIKSSRKIKIS
jgi:hypothetical protein